MIILEDKHIIHHEQCPCCSEFSHDSLNDKESSFLCHVYSMSFIDITFPDSTKRNMD
ncbi:hypothetical protein ACTFQF_00830 [Aliivibrio fischeri]|uniref:Uncharacterized protein n=1 Tax=Aliivibrio fischeri (strain MJ11) TaxID=388396 RepID=B5EW80_ALIFM|nr:hypothetical protein [Aliivibrio fischeri]ACH64643.1 hypothetical protein VFMJ11_B0137 [Aliivibrio fischeri MJ11]